MRPAAHILSLAILISAATASASPPPPILPAPYATPSVARGSNVIGWPAGRTPTAPPGFTVTRYASGFESGRWLYELPNGDVLVSESYTGGTNFGRVTLLRDTTGAGVPDVRTTFVDGNAAGLTQIFGLALVGSTFYLATTDGLWAFPYTAGATSLPASSGRKLLALPAGGYNNHWTRNLKPSLDGTRLFITVGSGTNVDQENVDVNDARRAAILEYKIATGTWRVFAGGLRNPNGLDWNPVNGKLWTAVNERDGLGDDLVPDYVTSVQDGGFYGWPYYYFGPYEDPRHPGERPDLKTKTIVPDMPTGAHTASLGLQFYRGFAFPDRYRGGMFVGQHGSWNRSVFAGYRVAFVPFDARGNVSGPPQTFLGGFIADTAAGTVYGRPVGVIETRDGALLVTDDATGIVWRVEYLAPVADTPALASFMLFNADTDQPLEPLTNAGTVSFARLGTTHLAIGAEPRSVGIESVVFRLDGKAMREDRERPFTVGGDANSGQDYLPLTLSPGPHTLQARPTGFDGQVGTTSVIRFTVVP